MSGLQRRDSDCHPQCCCCAERRQECCPHESTDCQRSLRDGAAGGCDSSEVIIRCECGDGGGGVDGEDADDEAKDGESRSDHDECKVWDQSGERDECEVHRHP